MRALFFAAPFFLLAGCGSSEPSFRPGACAPGGAALELTGGVEPAEAKTYRLLPFTVAPGTGRIEVSYRWTERPGPPGTPLAGTVLDLGLYDEKGDRAGFRGWGGSRQGRIDEGDEPVFVQEDSADRGFMPGRIHAGVWHVELGIAAVSSQGADYLARIECKSARGTLPIEDPVDPSHLARAGADWYHGDFHMHAYHSNPNAPAWEQFVAWSREARLDFMMVTEYVTGAHWRTLGALQRTHPDLLVWPGREVITYFGHANVHGETPGLNEYRHGFEDVTLAQVQAEVVARGALFQVNHPTFFPPPLLGNLCRGCYFELGDQIDWDRVTTLEILTGPVLATGDDIGTPVPGQVELPFLQSALDLWDDLMNQGHRITAVSGSDSKGVEPDDYERQRRGYGSSATAVYAQDLSRAALTEALRAGRAYVRTRGVARSPALEFTANFGTQQAMFGGAVTDVGASAVVPLRVVVTGGLGQVLRYLRNGEIFVELPITADPFESTLPATRAATGEGPLGTIWRIETLDSESRTAIGNPIFLQP